MSSDLRSGSRKKGSGGAAASRPDSFRAIDSRQHDRTGDGHPDAGGSVVAEAPFHLDFAGADTFRFGDIAISPDGTTLFGSTLQSGSTPPTFFNLGLSSGTYTSVSTTTGVKLQIAYGDDGVPYGQSTGTGEFFTVNPAIGATTPVGVPTGTTDGFTDLASARCPQSP